MPSRAAEAKLPTLSSITTKTLATMTVSRIRSNVRPPRVSDSNITVNHARRQPAAGLPKRLIRATYRLSHVIRQPR